MINVSINNSHLAGATTVITGNRVWRSMSSSNSRRRKVTEQMWYAAEDCSRSVQQRLEMFGRCRLRVGYGNRPFVRRSGSQTPSKLRLCWMMKFVSAVWRCQAMKTFISQNGQLEIYPPWNFQCDRTDGQWYSDCRGQLHWAETTADKAV